MASTSSLEFFGCTLFDCSTGCAAGTIPSGDFLATGLEAVSAGVQFVPVLELVSAGCPGVAFVGQPVWGWACVSLGEVGGAGGGEDCCGICAARKAGLREKTPSTTVRANSEK